MAKIEDLVAQIPDERLKKAIGGEVRELKKNKKFGLVFDEHLPETVRLPKLPVKEGELVAKKRESGNELWRVTSIRKGNATVERAVEGYPLPSETGIEVPVEELVVVRSFGDPIYPALVPVDRVARGGLDKPWHMLINAENFHALQLLLYAYEDKVDAIYIDPPYNSGARDWKYNNDYVDENDPCRHSKWLSMMQKRLKLAKRLLSEKESVLIVTIDEKEYSRLGLLLEQIFRGCTIQMVTIVINPKGTGRDNEFSRVEEYAFFVFIGSARLQSIGSDMLTSRDYASESDVRWRGLARTGRKGLRPNNPGSWYPIFLNKSDFGIHSIGDAIGKETDEVSVKPPKDTIAVWPPTKDGHQYSWSTVPVTLRSIHAKGGFKTGRVNPKKNSYPFYYLSTRAFEKIAKGEIIVTGRGPGNELLIEYDKGAKSAAPRSVWNQVAHDAGSHGTGLLQRLIPGRKFPFPKSLYAVEDALRFFVQHKPDALIVDFFGGSGTTTHAVARLNRQYGGQRRSIVVTNNEVSANEAESLRDKGLQPEDPEWEALGIFEQLTRPRVTSAFTGRTPDGQPINGDYKFSDEFPMAEGFDENIEFFRLDFLDPDDVARGDAFKAILPILWMVAGCRGEREDSKGSTPWFIPKQSPFAVLIQEKQFRGFRAKLVERKNIEWVFLITDSEENFAQMRRTLGREYECVQLYKSYLENFRINTQDALKG
jgi:adenine-specific DNA-methyltransferase